MKKQQIIDTIKNETSGGNVFWTVINKHLTEETQMFIYEYIIEKVKLAHNSGYVEGLKDGRPIEDYNG